MKKNIFTLILNSLFVCSVFVLSGCGDSTTDTKEDVFADKEKKEVVQQPVANNNEKVVAVKENSQVQNKPETVQVKTEKTEENFKDYSGFQTKVKDAELQKIIDDTIKEYEGILATIDNDKLVQEKEITEPRLQNINELKVELAKEEENKQKECQSITTANEEACNIIEKNIVGIKNVITGIENDIKNSLAQLEVATLNNKRKLNSQMKNNVAKLVAQQKS